MAPGLGYSRKTRGSGGVGAWHKAAVGKCAGNFGNPTFPWLLELIRAVAEQIWPYSAS
jgi:hypothetical protein